MAIAMAFCISYSSYSFAQEEVSNPSSGQTAKTGTKKIKLIKKSQKGSSVDQQAEGERVNLSSETGKQVKAGALTGAGAAVGAMAGAGIGAALDKPDETKDSSKKKKKTKKRKIKTSAKKPAKKSKLAKPSSNEKLLKQITGDSKPYSGLKDSNLYGSEIGSHSSR